MTDERDQDASADRRRALTAAAVGAVLAFPLALLSDLASSQTETNEIRLTLIEYEDGRVLFRKEDLPTSHEVAVTGVGMVRLRFDELHRGRPTASTIRRSPPTAKISMIDRDVALRGKLTGPERQAIADELRRGGDTDEAELLETQQPTSQRRWGGWVTNTVVSGAFCGILLHAVMIAASYVRGIRDNLRASEGQCPACGYDLSGAPGGEQCPECGADLPRQARYWADRRSRDRSRSRK